MCLAGPAAAQVQNPGFETGNFSGWNTGGTGATFAVTTGNQYAGTYCAELTGTDGSLVDLTQEIPCSPNTKYYAALYFKTAGSLVAWDSHLDELDADHQYAGQSDALPTPAGSTPAWSLVSKTFTTGPNTHFLVWYNRANIPNGVKLYLDAYSLVELGPAGGVTNGGFELGSFAGWTTGGSGATFAISTQNPHSGDYCAELTGTTWSLVSLDQVVTDVLPNTSYTASVWVKKTGVWSGSPQPALDNKILELDADGNYIPGTPFHSLGIPAVGTCPWTKYSVTFTTHPNTRKLLWNNNANIRSGDKLFLDDYVLRLSPVCEGTPCNGGFETGDFDFWSTTGSGATFEVTTGNQRTGDYCAELTGTNWSLVALDQIITGVLPNTSYTASVWVKKTGVWSGTPQPALDNKILELDADGNYVPGTPFHSLGIPAVGTCPWTRYSVTFTTHPNTRKLLWNNNANIIAGDKLFLDDYLLRLSPACEGTPCNGGFETGDTDFWTTWGAGAVISVTDTDPHTGSYVLHVTGTSPDEGVVGPLSGIDQDVAVQPDKTYAATMWYRSTGNWANDAWDSKIIVKNASGEVLAMYGLGIPVAAVPEWTMARVVFKTPSDAAKITWNNQFDVHSTDHMYLDDLQLAEVTYTSFDTIGRLREAGTNVPAELDAVVTRAIDESRFFVESPDRSSGILVESPDFPLEAAPLPGDVLHLRGWITTSSYRDPIYNELVFPGMLVFRTDAQPVPGNPSQVEPLRPLGALLRSVSAGHGPVMEGLFVKVGGMVSNVDWTGTFEINDGSAGNMRVAYNYLYDVRNGDIVALTGCVVSSNGVRWLYITDWDEIQLLLRP